MNRINTMSTAVRIIFNSNNKCNKISTRDHSFLLRSILDFYGTQLKKFKRMMNYNSNN